MDLQSQWKKKMDFANLNNYFFLKSFLLFRAALCLGQFSGGLFQQTARGLSLPEGLQMLILALKLCAPSWEALLCKEMISST